MRSIPSVQRRSSSPRGGRRPRGIPPRPRAAGSFAFGFVRGAFFGTIAALVIAGTTGGLDAAPADDGVFAPAPLVTGIYGDVLAEAAPAPEFDEEAIVDSSPGFDRGVVADPAAAAGGGGSGGATPRTEPQPCPGYGSMEAMVDAARSAS
jgi:hypothetical protein